MYAGDETDSYYDEVVEESNDDYVIPEEDDLATDGTHVWEITETSGGSWVPNGRVRFRLAEGEDLQAAIQAHCASVNYWPNVWRVDDHGGMESIGGAIFPS